MKIRQVVTPYVSASVGLLLAVCLSQTTLTARAQDDSSFNFKLPSTPSPQQDDDEPHNFAEPSRIVINTDYPRFSWFAGIRPGAINLDQNLLAGSAVASNFSVSNYTLLSFAAGARADFTPRLVMDLGVNYSKFSVQPETNSKFSIQESSTSLVNARIRAAYCFYLNANGFRFCPGAAIGTDSFPIFKFVTNSALQVAAFNASILAGHAFFETPIGHGSNLLFGGSYGTGLSKGTSGAIAATSHSVIETYLGLNTMISAVTTLRLALSYEIRKSQFTQDIDTWEAKTSSYFATIAVSQNF